MRSPPLRPTLLRAGCVAGALVLVSLVMAPGSANAYFGYLSSETNGISGTGDWILGTTTIEWTVTLNPDLSWHYDYVFSHPEGATSHFLLETSLTFSLSDIWDAGGNFSTYSLDTWGPSPSNPGIPGTLYGIKFDECMENTTHIWFTSSRAPVWADFYSKDGEAGQNGINAAWNAGFTDPDWDPTVAAHDGSEACHILAPDTITRVVPEPSGVFLLGIGLLGCGVVSLRRQRHT